MSIITKSPDHRIFIKKKDLGLLLLDLVDLLINKKINFSETINNAQSIQIYDKMDALSELTPINSVYDEYDQIKSLDYNKFQLPSSANSLKNYFNLRFSVGFKISDLTSIWNNTYTNNPIEQYNSKVFLFSYLNIFPYEETWRITILKGNINNIDEKYNVLAQDLISDYFQFKQFVKKQEIYDQSV